MTERVFVRRRLLAGLRGALSVAAMGLAALQLAGCVGASGGLRLTTVESIPPDARVVVIGYGECVTPCVIEHDAPRAIVIAKAGFVKQELVIEPGDKTVTVELELAAPSADIDAAPLPDL